MHRFGSPWHPCALRACRLPVQQATPEGAALQLHLQHFPSRPPASPPASPPAAPWRRCCWPGAGRCPAGGSPRGTAPPPSCRRDGGERVQAGRHRQVNRVVCLSMSMSLSLSMTPQLVCMRHLLVNAVLMVNASRLHSAASSTGLPRCTAQPARPAQLPPAQNIQTPAPAPATLTPAPSGTAASAATDRPTCCHA